MTEDEFLDARDIMDSAVERALKVVDYFYGSKDTARVDLLESGNAVLISWDATSDGYDGYEIEENRKEFPQRLLFCSEAELPDMLSAWKAEVKRKDDECNRAYELERRKEREAEERRAYEALKAKYG